MTFLLLLDTDLGPAKKGDRIQLQPPPGQDAWNWLGRQVRQFALALEANFTPGGNPATRGSAGLRLLASALVGGLLSHPFMATSEAQTIMT